MTCSRRKLLCCSKSLSENPVPIYNSHSQVMFKVTQGHHCLRIQCRSITVTDRSRSRSLKVITVWESTADLQQSQTDNVQGHSRSSLINSSTSQATAVKWCVWVSMQEIRFGWKMNEIAKFSVLDEKGNLQFWTKFGQIKRDHPVHTICPSSMHFGRWCTFSAYDGGHA